MKKFSWFSILLTMIIAVPITLFVAWCLNVLNGEDAAKIVGAIFLTSVVMEKLWPTVIRKDKE